MVTINIDQIEQEVTEVVLEQWQSDCLELGNPSGRYWLGANEQEGRSIDMYFTNKTELDKYLNQ